MYSNNTQLSGRQIIDLVVTGSVGIREIERVDRIVPPFTEAQYQPAGKMRIEKKVHAAAGSIRLMRVSRAAYASAARMSSRSRSS